MAGAGTRPVGRSTINGWKRGEAFPQDHNDLIKVVKALRRSQRPQAPGDSWGTAGERTALLSQAKEARDARSYPARRQPAARPATRFSMLSGVHGRSSQPAGQSMR